MFPVHFYWRICLASHAWQLQKAQFSGLYSVAQVFTCTKSKSSVPGSLHWESFKLFLSQKKNHWRINSTWGRVKQEFKIKIQAFLRNPLFTLFLSILNCNFVKEGRNKRLEGEETNIVQNSGLGGKQSHKNTFLCLQAQHTNFKCLQALPSSSCTKRFSLPPDYT